VRIAGEDRYAAALEIARRNFSLKTGSVWDQTNSQAGKQYL
jgi:hypothetical protein